MIGLLGALYAVYRAYRDRRLLRLIAEHGPFYGTLKWEWRPERLERELYRATPLLTEYRK